MKCLKQLPFHAAARVLYKVGEKRAGRKYRQHGSVPTPATHLRFVQPKVDHQRIRPLAIFCNRLGSPRAQAKRVMFRGLRYRLKARPTSAKHHGALPITVRACIPRILTV